MKFDRIFLKFEKLTSNYITKLSTYVRHKYEIFENFGAMLLITYETDFEVIILNCNIEQKNILPHKTNVTSKVCRDAKDLS